MNKSSFREILKLFLYNWKVIFIVKKYEKHNDFSLNKIKNLT